MQRRRASRRGQRLRRVRARTAAARVRAGLRARGEMCARRSRRGPFFVQYARLPSFSLTTIISLSPKTSPIPQRARHRTPRALSGHCVRLLRLRRLGLKFSQTSNHTNQNRCFSTPPSPPRLLVPSPLFIFAPLSSKSSQFCFLPFVSPSLLGWQRGGARFVGRHGGEHHHGLPQAHQC